MCACLRAGVNVVSNKGKLQWPQRNLGSICGDEPGQKKWDTPGTVTGTYKAGDEISTDIIFAQNHLGRVTVFACPLDAKAEGDCKALERCVPACSCTLKHACCYCCVRAEPPCPPSLP